MTLNPFGLSPLGAFRLSPLEARGRLKDQGLVVLLDHLGNLYAFKQSDGTFAWSQAIPVDGGFTWPGSTNPPAAGWSPGYRAKFYCTADSVYLAYGIPDGLMVKRYNLAGVETGSFSVPSTAWTDYVASYGGASGFLVPYRPRAMGLVVSRAGDVYVMTELWHEQSWYPYRYYVRPFILKITPGLSSLTWTSNGAATVYDPYEWQRGHQNIFEYQGSIIHNNVSSFVTFHNTSIATGVTTGHTTFQGGAFGAIAGSVTAVHQEMEAGFFGTSKILRNYSVLSPSLFVHPYSVRDVAVAGSGTGPTAHWYFISYPVSSPPNAAHIRKTSYAGTVLATATTSPIDGTTWYPRRITVRTKQDRIFCLGAAPYSAQSWIVAYDDSFNVIWTRNLAGFANWSYMDNTNIQLTQPGAGRSTLPT